MHPSDQEIIATAIPDMASHWAFSSTLIYRYIVHWLEATRKIDGLLFIQTIYHLLDHHEMLRLRMSKNQDRLLPYIPREIDSTSVLWVRLADISETERVTRIQEVVEAIYQSLNAYEGQLTRFVYFDHGDQGPGIFFFIFHHALFDHYSSFILFQDFHTIYHQLSRKEKVRLPQKTATYRQFMQKIQHYLEDVYYPQDRLYWHDLAAKVRPLPIDYPENRIVSFNGAVLVPPRPKTVELSLSDEETKQLYQYIPAIKVQVLHALLAALAQAFVQWTEEPLYIQLMDSCRTLFGDLNLLRSIGNFSQGLNMLLELEKDISPIDALRATTRQMNTLPLKGAGRGFINFAKDQASEAALFVPENIFVNYFGRARTDVSPPPGGEALPLFQPTRSYKEIRQRNYKPSLGYTQLGVSILVVRNKLTFRWLYDEQLYYQATIQWLAQTFLHSLQSMIEQSIVYSRR